MFISEDSDLDLHTDRTTALRSKRDQNYYTTLEEVVRLAASATVAQQKESLP